MRRRSTVYSGSKPVPPRRAPQSPPAVKPAAHPAKRFAWRRALLPAGITLLVLGAGALWLSQPRSLTPAEVEAIVHRAIDEVPPKPTATDAFEKILPSVAAVRAMPDDGEEGTKGMETGKEDVQR